jgi:hypothetical protein
MLFIYSHIVYYSICIFFINLCFMTITNGVLKKSTIKCAVNWKRLGILDIDTHIKERKCQWIGHTLRKPDGAIENRVLGWNPQGNRRWGCQKKTWWKTAEEEAVSVGKSLKEVWQKIELVGDALLMPYVQVGTKGIKSSQLTWINFKRPGKTHVITWLWDFCYCLLQWTHCCLCQCEWSLLYHMMQKGHRLINVTTNHAAWLEVNYPPLCLHQDCSRLRERMPIFWD